jgi:hypothetical protein
VRIDRCATDFHLDGNLLVGQPAGRLTHDRERARKNCGRAACYYVRSELVQASRAPLSKYGRITSVRYGSFGLLKYLTATTFLSRLHARFHKNVNIVMSSPLPTRAIFRSPNLGLRPCFTECITSFAPKKTWLALLSRFGITIAL